MYIYIITYIHMYRDTYISVSVDWTWDVNFDAGPTPGCSGDFLGGTSSARNFFKSTERP